MTEDERQRQMDFILNQQAQFSTDIQKLQDGQAKLQESQAALVERQVEEAQIVSRLAAVTLEGFKQTNAKIDALIDAQMRTEESVTKIAEAQAKLAEAQTHTEQRLDALIDIVREGRNGKS
jgi:chromosome segregation ATPase